jgi:NADPH-dependent glutamate synthase beta subunit-like oxidoreductase
VEKRSDGKVSAAIFQPQIIGAYRGGRPAPRNAEAPEVRIECNIIVVAIGQAIESAYFEGCGLSLSRDMIKSGLGCAVPDMPGVFAGGDCTFGPATVIRAIEAGKVSAANIDAYLGFSHQIDADIAIPPAAHRRPTMCGRVTAVEREGLERKKDFELIELAITDEEAGQECSRCLRCDHYGLGALKDGRIFKW